MSVIASVVLPPRRALRSPVAVEADVNSRFSSPPLPSPLPQGEREEARGFTLMSRFSSPPLPDPLPQGERERARGFTVEADVNSRFSSPPLPSPAATSAGFETLAYASRSQGARTADGSPRGSARLHGRIPIASDGAAVEVEQGPRRFAMGMRPEIGREGPPVAASAVRSPTKRSGPLFRAPAAPAPRSGAPLPQGEREDASSRFSGTALPNLLPQGERERARGFTLVELMIVVLVIGLLAAIAYPLYTQQIVKANRSAAQHFLMEIASRQERFLLDARGYTNTLGAGGLNMTVPPEVSRAYTVALVADNNVTPPMYTAVATPLPGTRQQNDGLLALDSLGTRTPPEKWQ